MTNLVKKYGPHGLRLIPPGEKRVPWFASEKKYPWIGYPMFWEEMTEEDRDTLYEVYQEEGLEALHDAVDFLDSSVWPIRLTWRKATSMERGRRLMEGR